MAGYANSINTNNTELDILTNGGNLNIATQAVASAVVLGNLTGATSVLVNSGTGGLSLVTASTGIISLNSSAAMTLDSAGNLEINSSAGSISIGNDNVDQDVLIATNGARHLTLGSVSGASQTTLQAGSAGLNITGYAEGALITDASGFLSTVTGTAGYVLTANASGTAPSFQAIGASFAWNDQTTATLAMANNNGYIMDAGASLITATLPATAAIGTTMIVQGKAAGLWTIAQNAGQTIYFGAINTTAGVTGSLSSTGQYDSISLVCITADTAWAVYASVGVLAYV